MFGYATSVCTTSTEIKTTKGLSIINGKVEALKKNKNIRLPHIGFNNIIQNKDSILLKNIDPESFFILITHTLLKIFQRVNPFIQSIVKNLFQYLRKTIYLQLNFTLKKVN